MDGPRPRDRSGSGAGALGVQLGRPVMESGEVTDRSELGLGDPADVDFMQSAVGLVWRCHRPLDVVAFLVGARQFGGLRFSRRIIMSREVVVLSAVRSAIGSFGGSLADIEPQRAGWPVP